MHVSTPGRSEHLVNMIAYCSKYYVSLHPFSLKSESSFFVAGSQTSGKTIWLRNQLLEMLLGVISSSQLHLSSE